MEKGYIPDPCEHKDKDEIILNDLFFGLVTYGYICNDCGETFPKEDGPEVV